MENSDELNPEKACVCVWRDSFQGKPAAAQNLFRRTMGRYALRWYSLHYAYSEPLNNFTYKSTACAAFRWNLDYHWSRFATLRYHCLVTMLRFFASFFSLKRQGVHYKLRQASLAYISSKIHVIEMVETAKRWPFPTLFRYTDIKCLNRVNPQRSWCLSECASTALGRLIRRCGPLTVDLCA